MIAFFFLLLEKDRGDRECKIEKGKLYYPNRRGAVPRSGAPPAKSLLAFKITECNPVLKNLSSQRHLLAALLKKLLLLPCENVNKERREKCRG